MINKQIAELLQFQIGGTICLDELIQSKMFSPWVESLGGPDKVCRHPNKTAEVMKITWDFDMGFNGNFILLGTIPLKETSRFFFPLDL